MPCRDILPDDLSTQIHERFVDVSSCPRRGFIVWCIVPGRGYGEGTGARDGAVFFEVAFVAHDDEGYERIVLDAHNLIPEFLELGERGE